MKQPHPWVCFWHTPGRAAVQMSSPVNLNILNQIFLKKNFKQLLMRQCVYRMSFPFMNFASETQPHLTEITFMPFPLNAPVFTLSHVFTLVAVIHNLTMNTTEIYIKPKHVQFPFDDVTHSNPKLLNSLLFKLFLLQNVSCGDTIYIQFICIFIYSNWCVVIF